MYIENFDFTYYYPPRPILSHIDFIDKFSPKDNWIAEIKMNGTNCEIKKIVTSTGHKWEFWDREQKLLSYNDKVPNEVIEELNSLNIPCGTTLNVELINDKTKSTKNVLFFHTILSYNNDLYTNIEYGIQRKKLTKLFKGGKFKHLWLAKHYKENFRQLFEKLVSEPYKNDEKLVEGLVLKNLKQKIIISPFRSENFGFKFRKKSKNYAF